MPKPDRTTRSAAAHLTLTLAQLEDLCDDPTRDLPGGQDVRALLTFDPDVGFYLSARDGDAVHQVVDQAGKHVRFRTIERALALLQDMPGLSPHVDLVLAATSRRRHHSRGTASRKSFTNKAGQLWRAASV